MRKEISVVALFVLLLGGVAYVAGVRVGRAEATNVARSEVEVPIPSPNDDWRRCLEGRHKEQLDYLMWRGKHTQQLEACTASLGEATRALVHRAGR